MIYYRLVAELVSSSWHAAKHKFEASQTHGRWGLTCLEQQCSFVSEVTLMLHIMNVIWSEKFIGKVGDCYLFQIRCNFFKQPEVI
mgnify:FL=1